MKNIQFPFTMNLKNTKIIIHNMKDGKIDGLVEVFNSLKNIKMYEINMKDGKVDGNLFFNKNNKKMFIENLSGGKIQIKEDNKTINIDLFKDGKINGKVLIEKIKDFDVISSFSGNFVEGILSGVFTQDSSEKLINGSFVNNKKHGEFNIINNEKNENLKVNFKDDILDGSVKFKNKNSVDNIIMKNGKLDKKNNIFTLIKYLLNLIKGIFGFIKNIILDIFKQILKLIKKIFSPILDLLKYFISIWKKIF